MIISLTKGSFSPFFSFFQLFFKSFRVLVTFQPLPRVLLLYTLCHYTFTIIIITLVWSIRMLPIGPVVGFATAADTDTEVRSQKFPDYAND